MSIEVTVNCDGCNEVMGAGKTAKQARAGLRHVRGIRLAASGGRDFCPDCTARHSSRSATKRLAEDGAETRTREWEPTP